MTKKYWLLLYIICFLISCEQPENRKKIPIEQFVVGELDSVYSTVLDESRKFCSVPPGLKGSVADTKYPVLFLLDGKHHFFISSRNNNSIIKDNFTEYDNCWNQQC